MRAAVLIALALTGCALFSQPEPPLVFNEIPEHECKCACAFKAEAPAIRTAGCYVDNSLREYICPIEGKDLEVSPASVPPAK